LTYTAKVLSVKSTMSNTVSITKSVVSAWQCRNAVHVKADVTL